MSEQDNNQQAAPSKEFVAHDTADSLLREAIQAVKQIIEWQPYLDTPTEAVLIVGHALIAKLDSMKTSQIDALNVLRERMSYLVAGSEIGVAGDVPTVYERTVIYRALEADYLANNAPANIAEMDAALSRFKLLAGL